jgi:hypothetical protein
MALISEVIRAGMTIYKRTFASGRPRKGEKREPRRQVTPESVRKQNDHKAERDLQIKLNANFVNGDYHLVLTYADPLPDDLTTKKYLEKFKRKINELYALKGIVAAHIVVTGWGRESGRIHHHMILSAGASIDEIRALWPHGHIRQRESLYSYPDFRELGTYLMQHHADEKFRRPDSVYKRRYTCSRSIKTPEVRRDEAKVSELLDPKPDNKNWYIDKNSIFEGVNPMTGRIYVEYVMLPLIPDAKYNKWRRLKRTRARSLGLDAWLKENDEHQLEFDIDYFGALSDGYEREDRR